MIDARIWMTVPAKLLLTLISLLKHHVRTYCPSRRLSTLHSVKSTLSVRMGGLSDFLRDTKKEFLNDLKSEAVGRWTVVMGNEAGGSFVACLRSQNLY